jgi:hypothetical protein
MKFLSSPRLWLLAALCLLPVMVSNDSLWLDEGDTAKYALEPDFSAWCQWLLHDGQADCQMPLAMLCAWVGAKTFGTQEWQLRAINLVWGALALVAMSRIGRRLQMPWLPLLLAIQPFFWFYLNEARPYALQLSCGAWLLAALVEFIFFHGEGTAWAWQLALATFFLFCATMLAPLPVAATVFAGAFFTWRQGWRLERKAVKILIGGALTCVPLAAYYLTTLFRSVKGSQMWHVDLKFILYVFYELTGMGGIGLSGTEIRSLARLPDLIHELAIRLPQLVLPLLLGALLAVTVAVGLRRQWRSELRTALSAIFLVPAVTTVVFIVMSLALQKAFWARHFAPAFPFFVTLLALAFAGIGADARKWLRLMPVAICILLFWSALNFRFAPTLRKEDYRAAAAAAKSLLAQGKSVWWLAGGYAATYYGLPLSSEIPEAGKAFSARDSRENCRNFPAPDVVFLNKPDIHDPYGTIGEILVENHYKTNASYQGFQIWIKAEKQH